MPNEEIVGGRANEEYKMKNDERQHNETSSFSIHNSSFRSENGDV